MVINCGALNEEDPALEHSRPSLRTCKVDKNESGSYGFHLTRTRWDPYPWIAGIEDGSPAQAAGLKVGDCVLAVNGEDVLGLRIGQIANKALSNQPCIIMLLWNAGSDSRCDKEVSAAIFYKFLYQYIFGILPFFLYHSCTFAPLVMYIRIVI